MIKLLPDNSEINFSRGVSMTYRTLIQQQLSSSLRREVAECLAETKEWVTNGNLNLTLDVDNQCNVDKYTKKLYVEDGVQLISIHCQCRYAWRKTDKWQYGYQKGSTIQILKKYVRSNCDYIAMMNRHLNQLILIPRSELDIASSERVPILNKMSGRSKVDDLYIIPYFENNNLEYFHRPYGTDSSIWTRCNLDGSPL